jgi:hypothetical protein
MELSVLCVPSVSLRTCFAGVIFFQPFQLNKHPKFKFL